jgi:phosphate acyltransferase
MRIVVDAMGSDNCPVPDVEGAILAAREHRDYKDLHGQLFGIVLVGDQAKIQRELGKQDTTGLNIEVVHAPQTVVMTDHPADVGRQKPDSSMMIGQNLVREGKADAFVTAGNTGAALALATLFTLKRIQGVKRPALSSLINVGSKTIVALDLGANADVHPDWLVQFGIMGSIYTEHALRRNNPTVALLSNGEEEDKGNMTIRDAAKLFASAPINFIGNVEPKEMLQGKADVVVTDGFVGNMVIKTMEALGSSISSFLRKELTANPLRMVGALLVQGAFRKLYRQVDPMEVGGAPLLGVNGVVIIGHGRSNAKGIKNAIRQARQAVEGNVVEAIRDGMDVKLGLTPEPGTINQG